MQGKLIITRDQQGYGARDNRGYIPASEIVAEWRGGEIVLTVKRSAVAGKDPRDEQTATTYLDDDERQSLIAWLSSLPFTKETP